MPDRDTPLARTFRPPVLWRSLAVAAVVGTILNAINQGPEIWRGDDVNAGKMLLTYCVPFFVASYGAWSAFAAGPGKG